jgi:hypothetical protein
LSCALASAERFAGIVAAGADRWGRLLRSLRHGGGFCDAIVVCWTGCCFDSREPSKFEIFRAVGLQVTYPCMGGAFPCER